MNSMRRDRLIAILILAVFGIPFAMFLWEFFAVDACLDRGGAYDYARDLCDLEESHPGQNSLLQHPLVILITASGTLLGLSLVITHGLKD